MSECEKLIFNNITENNFNSLLLRVKNDYGFDTKEHQGTVSKYAYTISWKFCDSNLEIQILQKPDSITCAVINHDISYYVRNSF